MSPAIWALLMELAMEVVSEMLERCDDTNDDDKRELVRSPSPFFRKLFLARLRRRATAPFFGPLSRREWQENYDDIVARLDSEHAELVQDEAALGQMIKESAA